MTLDFMSLKSISTSEIRAGKQKEKEIKQERAQAIEQVMELIANKHAQGNQ